MSRCPPSVTRGLEPMHDLQRLIPKPQALREALSNERIPPQSVKSGLAT